MPDRFCRRSVPSDEVVKIRITDSASQCVCDSDPALKPDIWRWIASPQTSGRCIMCRVYQRGLPPGGGATPYLKEVRLRATVCSRR